MSEIPVSRVPPPLAYAGPGCPRCGARLAPDDLIAGLQPCAVCHGTFEAMPFPRLPAPPAILVRSVLEAGPGGAAPCALHAGNAAESPCDRCGVLMCALCRTEADGASLCPGCFDRLRASSELPSFLNRYPNYAGRARVLGCVGCLIYVLGILTGPFVLYYAWKAWRQKLAAGERDGLVSLVFSVILGLAQIGLFVFVVFALAAAFLDMAKPT